MAFFMQNSFYLLLLTLYTPDFAMGRRIVTISETSQGGMAENAEKYDSTRNSERHSFHTKASLADLYSQKSELETQIAKLNDQIKTAKEEEEAYTEDWSRVASLLKPDVMRDLHDLFGEDKVKVVELLKKENLVDKSHDEIYGQLLQLLLQHRGESVDDFEKNREKQRDYVMDEFRKLIEKAPQEPPEVTFITGTTAVGKSSFVKQGGFLKEKTVHVNADDIRSLMVGNYWVYTQIINAGKFGAQHNAAQDTNKIRIAVQNAVKEARGNFLADSYTVPAEYAIIPFAKEGYKVRVFHLEVGVEGTNYEPAPGIASPNPWQNKVQISRERIQARIDRGEHGSGGASEVKEGEDLSPEELLMKDGFVQETRAKMIEVAKKCQNLADVAYQPELKMYISQNGRFDCVGDLAKVDPEEFNPKPDSESCR